MPRVILDPLAEAEFGEHLEIEPGALLDPLRLDQLACLPEKLDPLAQFGLDGIDRAQGRFARRDVMAGRIDREPGHRMQHPPGQRIEYLQLFDLVVGERDPHRVFGVLGRKHVDHVAAHAKGAASEVELVALVLHGH